MKTIGLIGGMSWESTAVYYRIINQVVNERLGGLHSAKIILSSVDFSEIERLQRAEDWEAAGARLAAVAHTLEVAGAAFLVLCTNTMHKVSAAIEAATYVPLLHIADPTAEQVARAGHSTVGLLGTRFTMEDSFYADRLRDLHGLRVLTPGEQDRRLVHEVIYDELCLGVVSGRSRDEYVRIIDGLAERGATAVILGCTEISLLVSQEHTAAQLFDTTQIHASAAAERALLDG